MPRYGDLDKMAADEFMKYMSAQLEADDVMRKINKVLHNEIQQIFANAPTADVVEIETLKAWLYEIAMNNVGCHVKDFSIACEEIASRLDGLRAFAVERRNDENS